MAKENFDRSKPHVNIGAIGGSTGSTDVGFVLTDGSSVLIEDLEDTNGDGLLSINIDPAAVQLCIERDGNTIACAGVTPGGGYDWTRFQKPIFDTGGASPAPLLSVLDLGDVGQSPPTFTLGQTLAVDRGDLPEWTHLNVHDTAALTTILADPPNLPDPYTGDATVIGFTEYAVPEPTSLALLAAAALALLTTRRKRPPLDPLTR